MSTARYLKILEANLHQPISSSWGALDTLQHQSDPKHKMTHQKKNEGSGIVISLLISILLKCFGKISNVQDNPRIYRTLRLFAKKNVQLNNLRK